MYEIKRARFIILDISHRQYIYTDFPEFSQEFVCILSDPLGVARRNTNSIEIGCKQMHRCSLCIIWNRSTEVKLMWIVYVNRLIYNFIITMIFLNATCLVRSLKIVYILVFFFNLWPGVPPLNETSAASCVSWHVFLL